MRPFILVLVVVVSSCAAFAQEPVPDPDDYEKVLIPLGLPDARPGAYGSSWSTELKVFNRSDQIVLFFQGTPTCRISAGCNYSYPFPTMMLGPGDYGNPGVLFASTNPSALAYVEKAKASAVHFSLHLREWSRPGSSIGTEVGVVRESEFRLSAVSFLNVPRSANLRITVRVYDVDPERRVEAPARVRLRAFEPFTRVDVLNTEVELPEQNGFGIERPLPAIAGYAELPLSTLLSSSVTGDRIIVEVEPITPGLRFWSMLSVTDNETQHVTLFTPQG